MTFTIRWNVTKGLSKTSRRTYVGRGLRDIIVLYSAKHPAKHHESEIVFMNERRAPPVSFMFIVMHHLTVLTVYVHLGMQRKARRCNIRAGMNGYIVDCDMFIRR